MSTVQQVLADTNRLRALTTAIFKAVDTDHSGAIDFQELRTAMNFLAERNGFPRPPPSQVEEAMRQLDTNRSGGVDILEFEVFVRSVLQSIDTD